jgi:hypothetical protein
VSDFLSRLAERALGAAPPLQPLLGSRFAAPAEPADGFVEETVERDGSKPALRRSVADASAAAPRAPAAEAAVTLDAPSAPLAQPSPAESHAPSTAEGRPPVEDRTPSPDQTAPAADVRAAASSTRPFAPDGATPQAREVAPSARAPEISPPSPVRASDRVPAGRVEGSRPRAEHRVETERARDELLMPASAPPDRPASASTAPAREDGSTPVPGVEARRVAGDVRADAARHSGEPADDREPREHVSDALLMPVARRGEAMSVDGDRANGPRGDARQPWAEHARVEKERPVVQVTIGRIEVRAVHPPAAPQPAHTPGWTPPVLSLDEYLKRGGGR